MNFLQGGGEMGEITRSVNWAATSLGTPDKWEQSLCTTLGIVLHAAFPMVLFWGEDLVCFYNDAFRPSLGIDGKHPGVGKKGQEVWSDIWEFIGPLIHQVMATGEAVYFEDQLVPFYRNGKTEDIYWTFSYSPAYGDNGQINGVFVTCTETTANINNLKRIAESEKLFRTMAEGTDILIALSDETSNATYFNKSWSDFTGRPAKDLLEFGWVDLVHIDDRDTFVNIYLTAFEKKQPWVGEFRMLGKDGQYHWLLVKGAVRLLPDDSFAGYISSSIDITENKLTENSFKEGEQQVRSIIESAPFPIGVYAGKEMRIQFANQSILDVWGKGNDVIGKLYSEILPELENQEIFNQLDNVYTTGIPFHARNQRVDIVVDNKLQPYYFNYSFTPVYDAEGKVYGVMNTAAETTDINVAMHKVAQSERNFRNMILQAPVAMCILLGPAFVVDVANELMLKIWGKPVADVINKPIFEGLPDAKEQGLEALMENVYRTGETFTANELPVSLVHDGKPVVVYQNFVYQPYRGADDEILGILAISIDVTAQVLARRKIEDVVAARTKELAEANSSLTRSNAELAQFAYIASHDLQEPVRKVSTYIEMLESNLQHADERILKYTEKIKNSSQRMHALIKGVLSYSELSKGNDSYEPVDLQQVIEDIKTDFELLIEQKNATIITENLPEISAIPLHMSQLFGNLISNALKFNKPGTPPEIKIVAVKLLKDEISQHPQLHLNTDYYKIELSDNGIGFDQEYAKQIFSIFQRLHGKKEYEGTGIGLAMCQKIVQNHHGEIYASAEPGKGSRFTIILPVTQVD